MKEFWKDIKEFEGLYQVSNFGRVKRLKRKVTSSIGKNIIYKEEIMKTSVNNWGYQRTILTKDGKKYYKSIHRLLAENFIPNPENKPCTNHKDGNKLNNHISNLEWATYKENNIHALKSGLKIPAKGISVHGSKLNKTKVKEIRSLYKTGKYTCEDLANKFGVCFQNISMVINRKTWRHV